MPRAQLVYTDKRGAGVCKFGPASELARKLETLRLEAQLYLVDESGKRTEQIGGCEYSPDLADDRRIKWLWWYDKSSL